MDTPLVGTAPQNYKYFYAASAASITSLVILFIITGYTAYTAGNMNEVISDLNELLPEAEDSLRIIKSMCKHENFTKRWGDIC
tara:strand:+ start:1546 stop:1794 length:249 start_codon:yes stop_codon:yes gene_type:complete